MLKANHAVRLGLRAATRNPELAFGKALLDQASTLLSLVPALLFAAILFSITAPDPAALLVRALRAAGAVRVALAGVWLAAAAIGGALGAAFWSGALPLLAADAELGRRPPSGNFFLLVGRGMGRVVPAGLLAFLLSSLWNAAIVAALVCAVPALARPSPALLAAIALVIATALVGGVLVDLLARLAIVRAAVFADGAAVSFAQAASLLGRRLGACVAVSVAFFVLALVVATASATVGGIFGPGLELMPSAELIALAPRVALGLATGVVLSWIEVARHGALAALAADAEGLIETPPEPQPPEPIVEALPAAELVVEALPVPPEEPPKE